MAVSHQRSGISDDTIRLWRVRRDGRWIDAHLIPKRDAVELRVRLDGERVFSRRFPSRAVAVADANRRLRDLQRVGWTTHW